MTFKQTLNGEMLTSSKHKLFAQVLNLNLFLSFYCFIIVFKQQLMSA